MIISQAQIDQYRQEGFLVLEGFIENSSCDRLRRRATELVNDFDPSGVVSIFSTHEQSRVSDDYFLTSGDKIRFFFEEHAFKADGTLKQEKERSINKIGHALHDLDPVFDRFSRDTRIRELIEAIGIQEPRLIQSMYIFKQPNIGGEVICHQDSTFLYTEPTTTVGLWFALEDATRVNGCLWAIPGGHRKGLKSRWVRTASSGMQFEVYDFSPWPEDELIPLQVPKGSLILLHGLVPHRSLENRSSRSRHAYTLHVISALSHYPENNWLQRTTPASGFK